MRVFRRREFAALGCSVLLVGGFGYVQSRGGWSEMVKVPPKRDDSTPALQNGFELLGTARTSEGERSPRMLLGELSLGGGSAGPIGSTRIWFRLPTTAAGSGRLPNDNELKAFVSFPNGKEYRVRWEVSDLSERIATLLVPAGYAPADWMDIRVEGLYGEARWRLNGIPTSRRAIPEAGSPSLERDGVTVSATAVRLTPKMLNLDTLGAETHTLKVKFAFDGKVPPKGKGVRLKWERFTPQYQNLGDEWDSVNPGVFTPGQTTLPEVGVRSPYVDQHQYIGIKGELEVVESVPEPVSFSNVRWDWVSSGPRRWRYLALQADAAELADGSRLALGETQQASGLPMLTSQSAPMGNGPSVSMGGATVELVDLAVDPKHRGWEEKVVRAREARAFGQSIPLGIVTGTLARRTVVKSVPFELLVPIGPGDSKDMATEKSQLERIAKGKTGLTPPRGPFGSRGIGIRTKAVQP